MFIVFLSVAPYLGAPKNPYDACVCQTNTPPEKKTPGKISLKNIRSETAEEFLLLDCTAKAHVIGVFFSQRRYDQRIPYRRSLRPVVLCPDLCSSEILLKTVKLKTARLLSGP